MPQWIFYCTEAAPGAPGASLFPGVARTKLSRRGVSTCLIFACRNRAQAAQPTHLVDELTRRRWFIVKTDDTVGLESIMGAPPTSQKRRRCGYVGNVNATCVDVTDVTTEIMITFQEKYSFGKETLGMNKLMVYKIMLCKYIFITLLCTLCMYTM